MLTHLSILPPLPLNFCPSPPVPCSCGDSYPIIVKTLKGQTLTSLMVCEHLVALNVKELIQNALGERVRGDHYCRYIKSANI